MNAVAQSLLPGVFDPATLQRARALALQSHRPVIAELEVLTGADPRQLVQAIAQPFGLTVVETADMLALAPAFDLLPLSKAMQRHCALLRTHENELVGVIADPFDPDLQTWMDSHAKASIQYCLALQADIQAYLSKQEESVRAVDHLVHTADNDRKDNKTAAVLSFASVSEAASPAVKLVNSALYDALKAGASMIWRTRPI
jgi:general secretion pathway protein E